MKVCILAEDQHVEQVRTTAHENEVFPKHFKTMYIPVSSTGEMPATHWFCTFDASNEMIEKLKSIQSLSEIVESEARNFLRSKGLKIIRA